MSDTGAGQSLQRITADRPEADDHHFRVLQAGKLFLAEQGFRPAETFIFHK